MHDAHELFLRDAKASGIEASEGNILERQPPVVATTTQPVGFAAAHRTLAVVKQLELPGFVHALMIPQPGSFRKDDK